MSIQTTRFIDRQYAIERINIINSLVNNGDWVDIIDIINEDEWFCNDLVNNMNDSYDEFNNITHRVSITKLPNNILSNIMNLPGYRYSLFENYVIVGH